MNILNYVSYFHDGSIIDIQETEHEILISMESAEISDEINEEHSLTEHNTLKGLIHIQNPKKVQINENEYNDKLQMAGDIGGILTFKVAKTSLFLFIEWINFPPKESSEEFSSIEIEADNIFWESAPDLFDPFGYNKK